MSLLRCPCKSLGSLIINTECTKLSDLGPGSEVRIDAGGDPVPLPGTLQEVAPRQVQGGGGEGGGPPEVRIMATLVLLICHKYTNAGKYVG